MALLQEIQTGSRSWTILPSPNASAVNSGIGTLAPRAVPLSSPATRIASKVASSFEARQTLLAEGPSPNPKDLQGGPLPLIPEGIPSDCTNLSPKGMRPSLPVTSFPPPYSGKPLYFPKGLLDDPSNPIIKLLPLRPADIDKSCAMSSTTLSRPRTLFSRVTISIPLSVSCSLQLAPEMTFSALVYLSFGWLFPLILSFAVSLGSDSSSFCTFDALRHRRGTTTSTGKSPEPLVSSFWKNSGLNSLSLRTGAFFFNIPTVFSEMLPPLVLEEESVGEADSEISPSKRTLKVSAAALRVAHSELPMHSCKSEALAMKLGLLSLVILAHSLEQRLHKQGNNRGKSTGFSLPLEVLRGEGANGVTARVPDGRIGVLEPLHDMRNDLGQMRGGGIGVGSTEGGEEAEALLLDGRLGVIGGVVEAVEEHWDSVVGEAVDYLLQVLHGDLVSVAVGELGKRGQDSLLQLHHCQVRR
nr:hypothetical protein Iba_chr01dCG7090 [Ipomoea batatas]